MSLRWNLTNYRQHHAWLKNYATGSLTCMGRVCLNDRGGWDAFTRFKRLEYIGSRKQEAKARELVRSAIESKLRDDVRVFNLADGKAG